MSDTLRVACVQLTSRDDKAANIEKAEQLVARAAATGADVVVLPEKWNAIGNPEVLHGAAETLEDGESVQAMAAASGHGITLVGGSITERREGRDKLSNTSIVFESDGSIAGLYRKIHMFDVEVGGHVYRRTPRSRRRARRPRRGAGWPGLTVWHDVRFPELYRILALQGAHLVTVPAHFTLYTGRTTGSCCPRPCRREPVLRRGRGPDRRDAPGRLSYAAVADRIPGNRGRLGAGRGDGHLRRARPAPARGRPRRSYRWPAGRQRPTGGQLLRPRAMDIQAVLFDLDFTLAKPGPDLGPEGYQRLGRRFGLELDPALYRDARAKAGGAPQASRTSATTRRSGSRSPSASSAKWAGTRSAPTRPRSK